MMKLSHTALVAALGLMLSMSVSATEKTLADVHNGAFPAEDAWAVKTKCLQCHVSYEKLAEATKDINPNPHKSHLGAVNCTECHKADKPSRQPELMCNTCHNFTLKH